MADLLDEFGIGGGQGKAGDLFDEFGLAEPAKKQNTSLMGDLGTDLKRGVQKLPGIATGLADIPVAALTNKRFVDETADKVGEVTGFQPSQWAEEARDEYSSERQAGTAEIDQAWEDGTAVDVAGAYISNPGNVLGMVAESAPQMLAGGVLGRGALAAGRATGVIGAPATAAQAATQGAIAGGVGEGAVIAGGTMDQIDDDVDPRRAAAASAGAGVAGAALGVLGAKAAQRLGVLDAESAIAGGAGQVAGEAPGLARRVAGGALTEGVLEELPQSASETMLQNWAEEKDLTEGLARASVEGTLAGSAIGAGVNVLPPRKRSEEMGLDPNAGPLSAAAVTAVDSEQALLPAPERLALPAPDQTLYADGQGNVSEQGPARDVDREQRPVPGREQPARDFGPGMEQQVERGTVPVAGELMPAAQPDAPVQESAEPRTFDAQPERQGIPDLREDSINVDADGNAVPGKIPTQRPADYVQGGRGMDQQAPVGKTYSNVLAAKNAIQRAGSADVLEAVQVGPKQFEVRAIAPPAASQEAPAVEPVPAQSPVPGAVSAAPDVAPAAADAPTAKPAPVKPAPQPVDRKGLPEILRHPKKMVITRMAKAAGIKKGSPGYDAAVGRLESDYERQVDDAQAALPFEQFNALNKESPEGVNRQAWTQLRKERGIEDAPTVEPAAAVNAAAAEAATSPANNLPEPTDAQKEAGNYRKGHVSVQGLNLAIENPKGSVRRGKRPDGSEWSHAMSDHYGYIKRTEGADGDHVDIYLGDNPASDQVFVIDQVDQKGGFDEHKVMLGFDSQADAVTAYKKNFDPGWKVGPVTAMPMGQFKEWLKDGDTKSPLAGLATAPATSEKKEPAAKPAAKIEDAGEKLGGARKDELRSVRERMADMDDAAIASSSLSQLWPKDEISRIEDTFQAASYQAVREYIPAKPRVAYKITGWVNKVKAAREIIDNLSEIGADATVAKMRKFSPGLRPIADKVELLMGVDRAQWGRIGRVSMASGSFSVEGKMTPGSWVEVDIDGRTKHFFGKNSIAEALDDVRSTLNLNSAPEKKMKFDVWTDRDTREVFIAKSGDRETRRLATFRTAAEARDHINNNHDSLVAAWDAVKNRDNVTKGDMRRGLNDERTGVDHRGGADITPEQFIEAFGFRGVEFGNWVAQGADSKGRQGMLNDAYDAFMDLAGVIDVPPKALSLNGSLGIGFGSRGKGKMAAHFEPSNIVINLTKTKGAGSLAHEWFHAADNYFARQRGGEVPMARGINPQQAYRTNNFITYRPEPLYIHKTKQSAPVSLAKLRRYREQNPTADYYSPDSWMVDPKHPNGVRPEVERAFAELVEVLDQSPMLRRSAALDKAPDGYWSRIIERGARAFETYVIAKLADRGYRNDYLANVRSLEEFARSADRYPYLTPDEQGPVSDAFDKLFATIETRVEADGNVALYSRQSYRQGQAGDGSRAVQLRMQLKRLTGGWQNAPDIKVVQSVKDLPDAQRRQVERDGAFDVEGMFADGQVYLVADNLRDVKHAAFVLQHEVLGHAGLQGAYGQRLTPLLMSLYNSNAELKAQADMLVAQYGYTPAVAMEEVLADMAAAGTIQQQPFWSRLVTAMRNALRSIGMNLNWSEGDIQGLLANARGYIVNGRRRPGARDAFSRDGRSGQGPEIVDEQGRLLAPNGKPSKLNQKQWHQVRSENFKRWFGNWQGLATQDRLSAITPIKVKVPSDWRGVPIEELQSRVAAAMDRMVKARTEVVHPEIGVIRVGKRGADKTISTSRDPAKMLLSNDIQNILPRTIHARFQSPSKPKQGVDGYSTLLAPIDVDGVPLVAVITIEHQTNGDWYYNSVAVTEKGKGRDSYGSPGAPERPLGETPITGLSDFVRRELERVNPDTVSKVTDGNGEPLVLYHGTAEQFTVFDQGRSGRSTGHSTAPLGIFLTNDGALARAYAEKATDGMPGLANVLPLFASIKKPYRMSVAESQRLDSFEKALAMRQRLEGEGFDGIQLGDTGTWVAFYNNQVKSATNNTGAFDEVDPDIRYSRASQRDTEALRKLGLAGTDAQNLLDQVRNVTLGGLQAKLSEWATRSEEGLFDGLAGIRRAEEAVGVTDADKQGYVSARMASGIADVMHGVLHYAAPEWRNGVIAGKADTRGVLEILGDLGQDNLTPWLAWLGGKRAQMLKAQGRENNLTDTEIAELIAMGKGKEALFEKVYKDYAKVNEAVLDLAEQAGLIDQSARAKWATEYYVPFYRQTEDDGLFTGPRSKKGLSHQSAAIKALKGGTLPTNDLLTNMLQGWTKRIDASMKNKALMEVVDNLQGSEYLTDESPRYQQVLISRSQIADQIRKDRKALAMAAEMLGLPAESKFLKVANQLMKPENEGFEQLWTRVAPTDPDIIRLQRDGKNEYYRVNDESLLRGLKFMEGSVFNDPITRIGRTFKRLLTTGVTASPDFILRNFIRDAAHAWMINKDGFVLGKDSIKGMRDALREDQDYRDLMFAGGSFQGGYVHGTDPEASAQIIRRALEKKGFTSEQQSAYMGSLVNTPAKVAGMLGKGWQAYRTLGDKVENANRLSTYKAAIAAGKSPRQAAYEAKDLMDYSLRGNFAAAQWFTDVVPFLNARMQGLYKLGRAVRGDKTLIAKEVAMKGGYIALFSLLLAGMNDDDERYQALMDWDKDMHWHIFLGDQHFRIPKPFELGLIFGTVPERLLHALTGSQDGGDLAKAVSNGVFQTLAFNPVPQFYQPIRELQANRNFFRDSPIEDMSDEGKLPEARFDERTSALGRALGQVTGPTIGLSPKQLDHLVQGYTGTLGGYVLGMSSLIASGFDGVDSPSSRASDLPVLKVLYQGDDVRSTQYQSEFYDMMQEADQLHRTVKSYRDEGKVEAAAKLLEGNSDKLKHRPALGMARQQLGAVRRQMDAVYRDTAMDGAAKRRRLEELQTRSNQIAERVVRLAGKDF